MTQESKDLLLKDLCARLPYSPICHIIGESGAEIDDKLTMSTIEHLDEWVVKPYLRSLSSMTEEETVEYCDLQDKFLLSSQYPVTDGYALFDWLNKKMFDYRGLIDKSLAIEVTDENNPYKN